MTDNRTPSEIERDIERERAQLTSTIDEIQERFSPDYIFREVTRGFREHGGDISTAVSRSIKENPIGLALTVAGIGWMMFGRSYSDSASARSGGTSLEYRSARVSGGHSGEYDSTPYEGGAYAGGSTGYERSGLLDEQGRVRDSRYEASALQRRRAFLADDQDRYPTWASYDYDDHDDDDGEGMMSKAGNALSSAADSVKGAASAAAGKIGAAGSAVGSGAASAGSSVRSGAANAGSSIGSGARSVGSGISGAAGSVRASSGRAYRSLAHGTENLSAAARDRVIAARESAVHAREQAMEAAQRNWQVGRDSAADFYEEQPLVVGALAMAVGAALASALPRTKYEDDAFGAQRDHYFDEAERIYHEERAKVERVASATLDEAKSVIDDERKKLDDASPGERSALHAAADEAKSAAARIADRAKSEAEKEKLGQPGGSDNKTS